MVKKLCFLLFALLQVRTVAGQKMTGDTIGFYYNGQIQSDWQKQVRLKMHEGNTILLQEKFPNGNLSREFSRYDDSLFVFTEYYEFPDTTARTNFRIKREGLVQISNRVAGDTIILFDPETYEEHVYLDTLLLPAGNWAYYFPDGKVQGKGRFQNFRRQGLWQYYDEFGRMEKILEYDQGEIVAREYVNRILEHTNRSTLHALKRTWIIHEPEANGAHSVDPAYINYRFMNAVDGLQGIGDFYNFLEGGTLEFTKTEVVDEEYRHTDEGLQMIQNYDIAEVAVGAWTLINDHQLQIELEGRVEIFEIEYLSDRELRLIKK